MEKVLSRSIKLNCIISRIRKCANINSSCSFYRISPVSSSSVLTGRNRQQNLYSTNTKHGCTSTTRNQYPSCNLIRNDQCINNSLLSVPAPHSCYHSRLFNTSAVCLNDQSDKKGDGKDGKKQKDDEDETFNKMPPAAMLALVLTSLLPAIGMVVYFKRMQADNTTSNLSMPYVSWNEFVHDILRKGEVDEIIVSPEGETAFVRIHPGAVMKNKQLEKFNGVLMKIQDVKTFEEKLRQAETELGISPGQGIPVSYRRAGSMQNFLLFMLANLIPIAMIMIFCTVRGAGGKSAAKGGASMMDGMMGGINKAKFVRGDEITAGGKGIKMKEVAGLYEAKVEILEFIDFIKSPKKFKDLGAKIPRGALLLGPPGCGKTLLAKAVATEAKVPFLAMAGSEFVEMIGGLGASRVRDLFKQAREKAPCIIYIDEIDAIGRKRAASLGNSGSAEEEQTLNQLLTEMDGMGTVEGVIMIASTNRHEVLDKALLRPGRFDRHIMIDYPTLAERKEIFELYLSRLTLVRPSFTYASRLAQMSPGMTGADIANICNEAALHAARIKHLTIDTSDFEYAVERVVAGAAKKSQILSVVEKNILAYHEAGHAVVGWMLEHTDPVIKVSIVPRTSNTLGFAMLMPSSQVLFSKEQLFDRMCTALGGRMAESLKFNRVTSGAQDDLKKVTRSAKAQIAELGMSDVLGPVSFSMEGGDFANKPYSKQTAALIDQEVNALVYRAYQHTEKVLSQHVDKLELVAQTLLEKETINYVDMERLCGESVWARKRAMMSDDKPLFSS